MSTAFLNNILKLPTEISDQVTSIFSENIIKIAITGLSRSGKTVFITSLIDQLLYQNRLLSVTSSHSTFKMQKKGFW